MLTDYQPEDENPFVSETGRRLYETLLKRRRQRVELSDKIDHYVQKETRERHRGEEPIEQIPIPTYERVRAPRPKTEHISRDAPTPTLAELLDWYQCRETDAVVGQEKALIKMTLKAIMLNSFTLEGPAGRGKTYLLKALTTTLPRDLVYWFEFATDTTIFNKSEEINRYKILVLPEYQKILKTCPQTREAIKTITEGRIAKRQKMDSGEMKEFILYPKCVITAIADENEFKEALDKDKEDMRRFSHIKLDTAFDQTLKIREFKRQKRSMRPELMKVAPASLGERIQQHLAACINIKLAHAPLDPFAEFMDQYLPITDKSIAYVDDYYSYLDGCAKFHAARRMLRTGKTDTLVLDLADQFIVYQVYHDEFCKTLLKLDNLEQFGDRAQKALEQVNWGACFEAGLAKMRENYPSQVVDAWVSRQLTNNKLVVLDPLTHEEMALVDYGPQELVCKPPEQQPQSP